MKSRRRLLVAIVTMLVMLMPVILVGVGSGIEELAKHNYVSEDCFIVTSARIIELFFTGVFSCVPMQGLIAFGYIASTIWLVTEIVLMVEP